MTDIAHATSAAGSRRPRRNPATAARAAPAADGLALPAKLFVLSLLMPFEVHVGPMMLSVYRILLLVMILPCIFMWLSGRAGRILPADIALFALCGWVLVSLAVLHGLGAVIEPVGIFFVETTGAYLLARCYIRTADQFLALVRLFLLIVVVMLPFVLLETATGRNLPLEIAGKFLPAYDDVYKEPRWGLDRVQLIFEHPIHFGVFAGGLVGLVFCVYGHGRSVGGRYGATSLVTLAGFLSLSSGPLTAMIGQIMMLGYDRVFAFLRERWQLLCIAVLSLVTLIEIVANRSTAQIFIDFFAFNKHTAYNRLRIWEFGTANVAQNPLFGIGFNDWERPPWMTGSMDMFWLVPAVRNGLPAIVLLAFAFLWLFVAIARRRMADARLTSYKLGYLVCMTGYFLAGWTVHYWTMMYVLFMFLLASGAWLLSVDTARASGEDRRSARGRAGGRRLRTAAQRVPACVSCTGRA